MSALCKMLIELLVGLGVVAVLFGYIAPDKPAPCGIILPKSTPFAKKNGDVRFYTAVSVPSFCEEVGIVNVLYHPTSKEYNENSQQLVLSKVTDLVSSYGADSVEVNVFGKSFDRGPLDVVVFKGKIISCAS